MRSNVSYDQKARDLAQAGRKGLFTVDIIHPSKKNPGKLGSRTTYQGPADAGDLKILQRCFASLVKRRNREERSGE